MEEKKSKTRSFGGKDPEFVAEHATTPVPNVRCSIKLPKQSLNIEHLLQCFPTVFHGIVREVFRQQAGGAWFHRKIMKIHITILMPQFSEPHHWFSAVAGREGSWPIFFLRLADRAVKHFGHLDHSEEWTKHSKTGKGTTQKRKTKQTSKNKKPQNRQQKGKMRQ